MKNGVQDIDRGWKRIKGSLRVLDNSYSKIGVQAGTLYENRDIALGGGTAGFSDLVTIAAANEYGTKRIPSRPFMRIAFDKNQNELRNVQIKMIDAIEKNKIDVLGALKIIGTWFEAKVKLSIKAMKFPPNAPATIRKKKSSHPLIDTGQLIQSIRHVEVVV